jgi:hypothetical protein
MPKEPPATVASLRHKSYRNTATCHRRKRTAPGRETLRPHRNSTAEQQQGHPGAKRAYRRNAPRRDTRTAADRTRSDGQRTAEATRQKTPTPSTNQPPRPRRTAPTSAGTRTGTPPGSTPVATEPTTETPDAQQTRPPKARKRRRQRSKKTTSNQALQLATYNTQQSCLSVFDPLRHLVISLSMFMRFASSPGSLLGRDNCGFLDLTNDG